MKTLKELAQLAIDVQDACNLSGVVHSFSSTMTDLRAHLSKDANFSTTMLNQHPVCVLFSDKISSLVGGSESAQFSTAYRWALDTAAGE